MVREKGRHGDGGLCRVCVITHHSSGGGELGMGMVVSVGVCKQ